MPKTLEALIKQRRFQLLLAMLVAVAVVLGVVIVPVERAEGNAMFQSVGDGLWWSVTTVTGVGYGDVYPKSGWGRMVGVVLEIVGVLTFGLLVATVSVAMRHRQERWYWHRLFKRLDELEGRLDRLEKKSNFGLKNGVEHDEETGTD